MKTNTTITLALTCLFTILLLNFRSSETIDTKPIYQFQVEDLYGESFDFSSLKGKKIMIVNTASKCGLTPQYEDLEKLYNEYKDKNFIIIGFPANDFMKQEPGSNEEIAEFCTKNYGVTFPMMSKISVKDDEMAIIYQYLTKKIQNGHSDSKVKWNFQKYLIGEEGFLEKVIDAVSKAYDEEIINWIEN